MIKEESLERLKKISTFDFFKLHNKEEFELWVSKIEDIFKLSTYEFGNLNKYPNRDRLYEAIITSEKLAFEITSKTNSQNLILVLKKHCLNYLEGHYTEEIFCEKMSFYKGNCQEEFFTNMRKSLFSIFWNLYEFTEIDRQQLGSWKSQIRRECKELINEIQGVE